jgi:hypothetical protein
VQHPQFADLLQANFSIESNIQFYAFYLQRYFCRERFGTFDATFGNGFFHRFFDGILRAYTNDFQELSHADVEAFFVHGALLFGEGICGDASKRRHLIKLDDDAALL